MEEGWTPLYASGADPEGGPIVGTIQYPTRAENACRHGRSDRCTECRVHKIMTDHQYEEVVLLNNHNMAILQTKRTTIRQDLNRSI